MNQKLLEELSREELIQLVLKQEEEIDLLKQENQELRVDFFDYAQELISGQLQMGK